MIIVRTIVAALFALMALGILVQFRRVKRPGLLLGAASYGGGAYGTLVLGAWWPLLAGFAAATVFARLGAVSPTDLRHDLPDLDPKDASSAREVQDYLTRWLRADRQVALVASNLVQEAWNSGLRGTVSVRRDSSWHEPSAESAWREATAESLRRLATASREDFVRHLDWLDAQGRATIAEAGERAVRYEIPATPTGLAQIQSLIPSPQEQDAFVANYVADCVIAARLRVLAWTFQQWHGERYVLPERRTVPR
jgi:hypothetical protein